MNTKYDLCDHEFLVTVFLVFKDIQTTVKKMKERDNGIKP